MRFRRLEMIDKQLAKWARAGAAIAIAERHAITL